MTISSCWSGSGLGASFPPIFSSKEDTIGPIDRGMRVNEQIRISPVRVINAEGAMLGVMPTSKALEAAREAGESGTRQSRNERGRESFRVWAAITRASGESK